MLEDSDLLEVSSRTGLDNTATHHVKRPAFLVADRADNTPRSWPGDRFHHLFEARLESGKHVADAHAIEFDEETHSFKDLIFLANRIGRYLQDQGASAGDVIALLFDRSIHAYASILAVSKIGCTFVPLDAGYPESRIEIICKDSGARFALTVSFHSARFANCGLNVIALDGAEEEYGKLTATAPVLGGSDVDDPILYIIYTSGTTGKPKGVPIRHSSICNFLRVAAEAYGFEKSDRVYQALTLAFDYSFEEIWVPLLSGACLVPAPQGVNLLGDDLAQYLIDRQITAWCSVPTILATIEWDLPDLRLLIVSGEACSPDLLTRWWTPHRRFLNVYGPTETTVSATCKVLQRDEPVTIGSPLPTYTSMILSIEKDELLAIGEAGELALAGVGLADGYLNREAETSKAFVADFLNIEHNPGGLIYRTGDLARINQIGEIEYLGRVDTQVKIRGYRIELGEIEAVARKLSGVASLVVNPVEVEAGNVELALFYVAEENDAVDVAMLHDTLRDQLPAYMVPVYFEQLEALPLLANLKLDRKKLPLPSGARLLDSGKEFVEPAEGIEADLAIVLAGALKIERVSADADFFNELGANSLVMARYLGNVRKKLGIKTSMKAIYQHSTIQTLANAVAPPEDVNNAPATPTTKSAEMRAADTALLDTDVTRQPEAAHVQPLMQSASVLIGLAVAGNGQGDVDEKSDSNRSEPHRVSTVQYVAIAVAQLAWITFVAFVIASAGLALTKWILLAEGFWQTFGHATIAYVAMFGGLSAFLIAVKWIAVGHFKPGVIPVWTPDYLRFWIAQTAIRANPMILFVGTPAYNVFLRLLGAKVGKGTLIYSPPPVATDLISIGSDTVIRQLSIFHGYTSRNGRLHLGTVKIGSRSYLGEATVMDIESELGDDAQLGNRSALHEGQKGEGGKIHLGSPAIVGTTDFIRVPVEDVSPARARLYTAGQFIASIFVVGPAVTALLLVGTQMFFGSQGNETGQAGASIGILAPFGASLLAYFGAILIGILWVFLMPKVWNFLFRANEIHKLFSFQYFLARRITASSNNPFLQTLFGDSALIVPYFKAIGYDLKNLTQNGSNFGVQQNHHSPFLCAFSANTLVSDGLFMINMDLSRSSFKMSNISVPKDAYLGNDLHYPPGAMVGENCLIATKAMVPIDGEMRVNVGVLGSPPFDIPRSKEQDGRLEHYKQEGVFEQRLQMKLKSNLVTLALFMFRNWTVVFITTITGFWMYEKFGNTMSTSNLTGGALLAVFATVMLLFRSFYNILYERLVNWYRPMKPRICSLYERPFWDHERFWKMNIDPVRELVFAGTPIKNLVSMCQGVDLGKQVFDNGCAFSEPHLVTIGDYCTLNYGSIAQGHSLEDGTFKSDSIRIGERCTLGVAGFVHYGADIGDDADIRTDAFVMKGSIISDGETWTGNPAAQISSSQEFGAIRAIESASNRHNNSTAGASQ